MATHAPITGASTRAPAFILNPKRRASIESEIELHLARVERLLARLDRVDAPVEDLEDDDPSGDPIDQAGETSSDDGRGIHDVAPLYATDQCGGPINYLQAQHAQRAAELGLVRSASGGWRSPN